MTPVLGMSSLPAHPCLVVLSFNSPSQYQFHTWNCPSLSLSLRPKSQLSLSSPSPLWHIPRQSPKPLNSSFTLFLIGFFFPSLVSTTFMPRLFKQPYNWALYSTTSLLQLTLHTTATLIILKYHFHYHSSSYSLLST